MLFSIGFVECVPERLESRGESFQAPARVAEALFVQLSDFALNLLGFFVEALDQGLRAARPGAISFRALFCYNEREIAFARRKPTLWKYLFARYLFQRSDF